MQTPQSNEAADSKFLLLALQRTLCPRILFFPFSILLFMRTLLYLISHKSSLNKKFVIRLDRFEVTNQYTRSNVS